ncbi:hypothetical protein CERSUDRAFT_157263 [Gelatoporia subvermispora B]|uniref:BUB1 N-terminal domain-containing protein n=1 Tax=Ceriporiopsis subvermispora (strain B) TaxID=914234 RepID=M2R9P7_CERS8|nr:hypothetical protein CERSUDRAFT_157263 [Gelatoporia subvermispora B]
MADVFDDAGAAIVDGDLLEAAKENIQPLARGRRVTALSAILSTPHAQRESRLAAARNRYRINVEVALGDEDDDPLEAYCRFVDWTVENYPQGHSAESGILELLEEATRVLKDDREGKWRGDMRYLKLWALYASYVEKPAIIYKFLMVNEIGTSHSLLYEEFATVLERAGRRTEADEVYLLGIAWKADPVARLENKHRDFQKRMMSAISLPPATPTDSTAAQTATSSTRRTVLGETPTPSSSSGGTRATRSSSRLNPSTPTDTIATPTPAVARPNARMQVFVDPSGTAENDPSEPSPWPELGTRKSRIKENIPEVSKAAGTTLRQAGRTQRAASGAGPSRIAVYRDPTPEVEEDETASMPPPPVPASKKEKTKSSIAVFRDDEAESDQIEPAAPATKRKAKAKSTISIFRDEEPEASGSRPAVPETKKTSKSAITVFVDEDAPGPPAAPPKKNEKAKSGIAVFRDEEQEPSKGTPKVPSTPKFTPFRDEEHRPSSAASTSSTLAPIIKPKPAVDGARMTEAEALRKDPFKNYSAEERPTED